LCLPLRYPTYPELSLQVFKFDRQGTLLLTLGTKGGPDPDLVAQDVSDNSDPCLPQATHWIYVAASISRLEIAVHTYLGLFGINVLSVTSQHIDHRADCTVL
jgi:hypothetical protein